MESSKNESSEVYIKVRDLIYVLLKNLGIILIAGIVLGGALFGYRFAKKTTTANVLDTTVRISASETDKEYQTRVGNVERARDIVDAIGELNEQIDNQRHYVSDSVFMKIDPENEYESTTQILITLEDSSTSGLDMALVSAYERDIRGGSFLDEYSEKIGTRPDYVKELIIFTSDAPEYSFISVNNYAISMYIRVYGPTYEFTKDVMDLVIAEVQGINAELSKSVAPHKVTVLGTQEVVKYDPQSRDYQVNHTGKLETLQKQIATYYDSLDSVADVLGVKRNDIINYFEANERVVVDGIPSDYAESDVSTMSMIKSSLKYAVLGFLAGAFIVVLFYILKYIFGKKIITQAQFFSVFGGIKKIGVLKPSGNRCKYTEFIEIKAEDDSRMSADNTKKLISANYGNLTRDLGKVLITGTADKKKMDETVKALGLKGDYKPDIFSDPDILTAVPDYDGVVLIEQRGVSTFKNVSNEIELISNGGTKIVGAVII